MIVALLNQKGGVGKTTLATHIAGELAMRGQSVILIIVLTIFLHLAKWRKGKVGAMTQREKKKRKENAPASN